MSEDSLETQIKSIQQDIEYIKMFIEDDRRGYRDHVSSAQVFRDRIISLEQRVDNHSSEHNYYRWLFGIIIAIGVAMLGKLYL